MFELLDVEAFHGVYGEDIWVCGGKTRSNARRTRVLRARHTRFPSLIPGLLNTRSPEWRSNP
jgi:hypothetical protein